MNDHQFDPSDPDRASYTSNGRYQPRLTQEEIDRQPRLTQEEIDRQEPDLAQQRREDAIATRRELKQLYAILLTVGISLGALVSVGVVLLLDRFDLARPQTEVGEPNE